MIFDHIGFTVWSSEKSKEFYTKALAPLGVKLAMEMPGCYAFGKDMKPQFWFWEGTPKQSSLHVAFAADSREQVRSFYDAAIAAGGEDNGPPGLRLDYHPTYYAAFVRDPDGNNIEAVCHKPE